MTEQRAYLAVPLTPSEAQVLRKGAAGRIGKYCCDHLDVFHNDGRTSEGGTWRTCTIWGCGCTQAEKPDQWRVDREAFERRVERRDIWTAIIAWSAIALSSGLAIGYFAWGRA